MTTPFLSCFHILSTHKGQVDMDLFMSFLNSWTDTVLDGFRLGHFICKEHTGAHNIQFYLFIAQGYCSKLGYGALN